MLRKFLLKSALKAAPKQDVYAGWDAVKCVQLLFDVLPNQTRPEIDALQSVLKSEGKTVHTLIYHKGKKPKVNVGADMYFPTDLTLLRKPRKRVFERTAQNATVLIDWSTAATSPNDFLAIGSATSLKIGVGRNLPCFNITIAGQGNMPNKVIDELLKYLKMINHG
jgi:hypothetical protein